MLVQTNQEIKGFYFGKDYYDINGVIVEIKQRTKNKTAILLQTQERTIITWVSKVVYV
jgi:hypothetical protein